MVGEAMDVLVSAGPGASVVILPGVRMSVENPPVRLKMPCCGDPAVQSVNVTGLNDAKCGESDGHSTIHSADWPCATMSDAGGLTPTLTPMPREMLNIETKTKSGCCAQT